MTINIKRSPNYIPGTSRIVVKSSGGTNQGTPEAGYLGYVGYLDVGGAGQTFWVDNALGDVSSMFPLGTSIAIYNTDDWSLAPAYFSVVGSEYYSGSGTRVTWIPVPTPAPSSWYYPAGTVLAKVGEPTPVGASVLIDTAVATTPGRIFSRIST